MEEPYILQNAAPVLMSFTESLGINQCPGDQYDEMYALVSRVLMGGFNSVLIGENEQMRLRELGHGLHDIFCSKNVKIDLGYRHCPDVLLNQNMFGDPARNMITVNLKHPDLRIAKQVKIRRLDSCRILFCLVDQILGFSSHEVDLYFEGTKIQFTDIVHEIGIRNKSTIVIELVEASARVVSMVGIDGKKINPYRILDILPEDFQNSLKQARGIPSEIRKIEIAVYSIAEKKKLKLKQFADKFGWEKEVVNKKATQYTVAAFILTNEVSRTEYDKFLANPDEPSLFNISPGHYMTIEAEGNVLLSAKSVFPADSIFSRQNFAVVSFMQLNRRSRPLAISVPKEVSLFLEDKKARQIDNAYEGDDETRIALITINSRKAVFDAIASKYELSGATDFQFVTQRNGLCVWPVPVLAKKDNIDAKFAVQSYFNMDLQEACGMSGFSKCATCGDGFNSWKSDAVLSTCGHLFHHACFPDRDCPQCGFAVNGVNSHASVHDSKTFPINRQSSGQLVDFIATPFTRFFGKQAESFDLIDILLAWKRAVPKKTVVKIAVAEIVPEKVPEVEPPQDVLRPIQVQNKQAACMKNKKRKQLKRDRFLREAVPGLTRRLEKRRAQALKQAAFNALNNYKPPIQVDIDVVSYVYTYPKPGSVPSIKNGLFFPSTTFPLQMRGLRENEVVYVGGRLNKDSFFDVNISYIHDRLLDNNTCTEQQAVLVTNGARWRGACLCDKIFQSSVLARIDATRNIRTSFIRCAECGYLMSNQ